MNLKVIKVIPLNRKEDSVILVIEGNTSPFSVAFADKRYHNNYLPNSRKGSWEYWPIGFSYHSSIDEVEKEVERRKVSFDQTDSVYASMKKLGLRG